MGQPNLFFSGGVLKVNFSIDIGFKTGKTVVGFSGLLDGSSRTILRFFLGAISVAVQLLTHVRFFYRMLRFLNAVVFRKLLPGCCGLSKGCCLFLKENDRGSMDAGLFKGYLKVFLEEMYCAIGLCSKFFFGSDLDGLRSLEGSLKWFFGGYCFVLQGYR